MKLFHISLTLLLTTISTFCWAQVWTLDECLRHSLANNRQIKLQRLESDRLHTQVRAGYLDMLPALSFTFSDSFGWKKAFSGDNNPTFDFTGSLTLFHGLSAHWKCRTAEDAYEISRLEESGMEEDLTIETIEAYLQLGQSYQQLEYARSGYESSLRESERTNLLVESGLQPLSARYQIESQLSADRAAVVEAESAIKSRTLELCQLMDVPYSENFVIDLYGPESDTLAAPSTCPSGFVEKVALRNPKYIGCLTAIRQNRNLHKQSIAMLSPEISFVAGYSASLGPSSHRLGDSFGISISLPICGAWQHLAKVQEAKIGIRKAETEAGRVRREIESLLEKITIETENCYGKALAARDALKASEELMRTSELKYSRGLMTATDYLLSRNELDKARSTFLKEKWQYLFRSRIIEYYMTRYCDEQG
ncbi:MAG: TolC family protein [Bacteroidales bacterium]|nr:TolC family protein [Candidatus Cacconaster merdequi]